VSELPHSADRSSVASRSAKVSALIALCLVALQLVTALHFALVPHGFSAGLNGFVHVHGARSARHDARSRFTPERRASGALALVGDGASCASESCPIGFVGHHSVLPTENQAAAVLALVVADEHAPARRYFAGRSRVLLAAPKTSPPV
jgi:hypothetical protein